VCALLPPLNKIYLGDAWVDLARLPDKCVDVTYTDPPFSATTHDGARTNAHDGALIDFEPLDFSRMERLLWDLCRVTCRWVILHWDIFLLHWLERLVGLELVRVGSWHKIDPAPQKSGDRPAMGWEAVAILHPPGAKRWNGGGRAARWTTHVSREHGHPAEKPLVLAQRIIADFSDRGEIILDPFTGSGTIPDAARRMGRRFLAYERDERWVRVAQRRLSKLAPIFLPGCAPDEDPSASELLGEAL
jgi:site-specific DNA-methyltransferase (adenine-specific)